MADLTVQLNGAFLMSYLAAMRESAGLTQEQLGKRIHRSQSWVAKFERSMVSDVKLGDLRAYCKALGATFEIRIPEAK